MKTAEYKTLTALVGAAVILFAGMPQATAADYAGSIKGAITKQDAQPIVNGAGSHAIVLSSSTGKNISTGKQGYFDGADVVIKDVADMVNGNGSYQGYITFSKDGEQVTNRLDGKVVTVMAPDGKTPMTTIEGTFDGVFGTNLYGTMHPYGTFKVTFTSPTEYVSEWELTQFK